VVSKCISTPGAVAVEAVEGEAGEMMKAVAKA
jgi:hypothetical protein